MWFARGSRFCLDDEIGRLFPNISALGLATLHKLLCQKRDNTLEPYVQV